MQRLILPAVLVLATLCGCVRNTDIHADARLRSQAYAAFGAGNYPQAKALIARADTYHVPQAKLWRRTLELRIAQVEGKQQGELRNLLQAWGEQRDDWEPADRIDAELTIAETLTPNYALDWLYDLDPVRWSPDARARYNQLFSRAKATKAE